MNDSQRINGLRNLVGSDRWIVISPPGAHCGHEKKWRLTVNGYGTPPYYREYQDRDLRKVIQNAIKWEAVS